MKLTFYETIHHAEGSKHIFAGNLLHQIVAQILHHESQFPFFKPLSCGRFLSILNQANPFHTLQKDVADKELDALEQVTPVQQDCANIIIIVTAA